MNYILPDGLGDAVLGYPIIKKLAESRETTVQTKYPEIFSHIHNVTAVTTRISGYQIRYPMRGGDLSHYEEMCKAARIAPPPFTMPVNPMKIPDGKAICVIKEPCAAHMHKAARDFTFTPRLEAMQEYINAHQDKYAFISVGVNEVFQGRLTGVIDMVNKLTVTGLLSLVAASAKVVTQIGHLVPIAQAFAKDLVVFESPNNTGRFKRITAEKVSTPQRLGGTLEVYK